MRCGIFVKIRGGQLAMFVPFANNAYTNTWAGEMEVRIFLGGGMQCKHVQINQRCVSMSMMDVTSCPPACLLAPPVLVSPPYHSPSTHKRQQRQPQFDSADGSMEAYYQEKTKAGFRKENILPNVAEWWANGNMIDNEKVRFV